MPESSFNSDRRRRNRVRLDRPLFAVLQVSSGERYRVMLADISPEGAQLLLPPGLNPETLPKAENMQLTDFSEQFACLNGVEGKLAWHGPANCGMVFLAAVELPPL